jgi:hypothetical protein
MLANVAIDGAAGQDVMMNPPAAERAVDARGAEDSTNPIAKEASP